MDVGEIMSNMQYSATLENILHVSPAVGGTAFLVAICFLGHESKCHNYSLYYYYCSLVHAMISKASSISYFLSHVNYGS